MIAVQIGIVSRGNDNPKLVCLCKKGMLTARKDGIYLTPNMEKTKEEILREAITPIKCIWDEGYPNAFQVVNCSNVVIETVMQTYADLQNETLKAENFKLAAMACFHPTGDEYGNRTCNDSPVCMTVEVVASLKAENERLRSALSNILIESAGIEPYFKLAQQALNPTKS